MKGRVLCPLTCNYIAKLCLEENIKNSFIADYFSDKSTVKL